MPERSQQLAVSLYPLILLLIYSSNGWSLPTQTIAINASIVSGCVVSGTNTGVLGTLNFGSLPGVGNSSASAIFEQNSVITLACTPGAVLSMSIDGGRNYSSNTRNLQLANNTNRVAYSLYSNSGLSTIIPVNQNVPLSYSNNNNILLPIYGQVLVRGTNSAGIYSDTLTVTLSW